MSESQSQRHSAARRFYDRISKSYDLIADSGEHRARVAGLQMLAAQPGETVLEIGYGTGHSMLELAQSVGISGKVIGIDISEGMQKIAQSRLDEQGLGERAELLVAAVPPIALADASVDAIFMSFTLELFPVDEIPQVLAECKRVLRKGGRLGVVSMASVREGESESWLERTYIWMHQHFPHIVDCQPIPLEDLVVAAGFEISQHERIDLFSMPVALVVVTH